MAPLPQGATKQIEGQIAKNKMLNGSGSKEMALVLPVFPRYLVLAK